MFFLICELYVYYMYIILILILIWDVIRNTVTKLFILDGFILDEINLQVVMKLITCCETSIDNQN